MRKVIGATKLAEEMNSLRKFETNGKRYVFRMPGNECEKKTKGVCPIEMISKGRDYKEECKCSRIFKELKESSFAQDGMFPSVIYDEEKQCYGANDGQHRLCIAYHLDMDIMIYDKIERNTIDIDKDSFLIIPSDML